MSRTAILILNWNGSEDTINCLQSLLPHLTVNDYVFVIDNGSSDDSVNKILAYFDSAGQAAQLAGNYSLKEVFDPACRRYLIANVRNLGFGAGNNVVLRQLAGLGADFELAWLLNNDALAEAGTLESLRNSMYKEKGIAAAGSLILNYPDRTTIQCSGVRHYKFFGVSKLINKNKPYDKLDKSKPVTFDYLNGASLMLNLKALEKAGYFDERFFLYSEELDLQLRLQKLGYTLRLDLESQVYHKLGGGTKSKKFLFYFYYNASAVLLSRKHFTFFFTFCAIVNLTAITFIRTFPAFKNFVWGMKGILTGLKKQL